MNYVCVVWRKKKEILDKKKIHASQTQIVLIQVVFFVVVCCCVCCSSVVCFIFMHDLQDTRIFPVEYFLFRLLSGSKNSNESEFYSNWKMRKKVIKGFISFLMQKIKNQPRKKIWTEIIWLTCWQNVLWCMNVHGLYCLSPLISFSLSVSLSLSLYHSLLCVCHESSNSAVKYFVCKSDLVIVFHRRWRHKSDWKSG